LGQTKKNQNKQLGLKIRKSLSQPVYDPNTVLGVM